MFGYTDQELREDANRLKIIELLQYLSIELDGFGNRTPYAKVLAELAEKYQVPSPFYRGDPARPGPQVPEGKVRNG